MTLPVPRNAQYPGCACDPCDPEPFRSLHAPLYSFCHPTVQRIKLAAVKTALYNPCLASLKRYDMDNVSGKLPEEQSQNTTTLCRGQLSPSSRSRAVAIHAGGRRERFPHQTACSTYYRTQFLGFKPHQNKQQPGLCP